MKAMLPIKPNERAANILGILAMIAVLLIALALAGTSLFASARINPEQYVLLKIDLLPENPWVNALFAAAGIALIILLGKIPVSKRFNTIFGILVLGMLALIGLVWVRSVKAYAESDGDALILIAEKILAGNYADLRTPGVFDHVYLAQSPYQFGLLAYLQLFVALFGEINSFTILRLVNVALLISSYGALLLTTQRLFHDDRVTFVTILLLCVCIQPVLNCTLIYGIIPAFALCVWAVYFTVRYLQNGKKAEYDSRRTPARGGAVCTHNKLACDHCHRDRALPPCVAPLEAIADSDHHCDVCVRLPVDKPHAARL